MNTFKEIDNSMLRYGLLPYIVSPVASLQYLDTIRKSRNLGIKYYD